MAVASSRTKSSGTIFHRSVSPSGRFCSSSAPSSSSPYFASSSSSFSSGSTGFFHRSASPTRLDLYGSVPSAPSVRFSIDRPISPSRAAAPSSHRDHIVKKQSNPMSGPSCPRRTCMCSPTNHPGSFRCSLHKGFNNHSHHQQSGSFPSNRLNARRSAMTNSLVRIGTVEGEWVKRALATLIRPSSHHQRRRASFHPRPSRLSNMSKAEDL